MRGHDQIHVVGINTLSGSTRALLAADLGQIVSGNNLSNVASLTLDENGSGTLDLEQLVAGSEPLGPRLADALVGVLHRSVEVRVQVALQQRVVGQQPLDKRQLGQLQQWGGVVEPHKLAVGVISALGSGVRQEVGGVDQDVLALAQVNLEDLALAAERHVTAASEVRVAPPHVAASRSAKD